MTVSEAEAMQIHPRSPQRESWQELVEGSHERIAQERAGRELPPPEEIIRWMREEDDDQPVPFSRNQGLVDWLLACPEKGFFVPIDET